MRAKAPVEGKFPLPAFTTTNMRSQPKSRLPAPPATRPHGKKTTAGAIRRPPPFQTHLPPSAVAGPSWSTEEAYPPHDQPGDRWHAGLCTWSATKRRNDARSLPATSPDCFAAGGGPSPGALSSSRLASTPPLVPELAPRQRQSDSGYLRFSYLFLDHVFPIRCQNVLNKYAKWHARNRIFISLSINQLYKNNSMPVYNAKIILSINLRFLTSRV